MVSQKITDDRETDRRKLLAGFLYDCAKMIYGSVAIGGLSPLFTGKELAMVNIGCIIFGFIGGTLIAYAANYIMKFKKQTYDYIFVLQHICLLSKHRFFDFSEIKKRPKMVT